MRITPPHEVLSLLGSSELLAYSQAMQYPFMQATHEIQEMLQYHGIQSYEQLSQQLDVVHMINERAEEIDREAGLSGHEVLVHNPHGRFFPLVDLTINGLVRPRLEIQKSNEDEGGLIPMLAGTVLKLTVGESLAGPALANQVSLGISLDADMTLSGEEIPGYWFVPFGGNDIIITPPASLN